MKVYSAPLSLFGAKAEIAAHEKGIDFELVMVPFDFRNRYGDHHPDVKQLNPKKQVPVLVDGDLATFDSTQIFEYLEDARPEPALWPREPKARARARLLELKADEVLFPQLAKLMARPRVAPEEAEAARGAIRAFMAEREAELAGRDYLLGEFTYADIGYYMTVFFASFLGTPVPETMPHTIAWCARMTARPAVARVIRPMVAYLTASNIPAPGFAAAA